MTFEFDFILVGLMQIIGFFVQGCTGFGCTVIAAAVTNGLLGTAVGVPYGTLITLPFLYYLAFKSRHEVSWKDLLKIVVLCAPGIVLGNYLFYSVSETTAKIGIGVMVTIIALMNIYKYIIKPLVLKKEESDDEPDTLAKKIFSYGCLLVGGVVHGAFNIGGPLITVYTIGAVKDKEKFRNTMNMVWVVLNTYNAFNQYRNGAWNGQLFSALAIGVPMAAVGFFLGMSFLKKINRTQFLRIVYCVLLIIGGDMLIRNLLVVL
ncbi:MULTISPECIES: sulfite exporter TauE/SafE family protein [Terrisporobacter]|uniref:Probable membrane transporter protein n=1 Tax=Terrisporobacter hibernicus TaxID=2813371 RepID=A0AAX2ZIF9_9FIRM|nr:sulfite exporter TauE/SafE family protein [Terrisporobacter hibernicus]UEL47869.1 sulfite exporter TauE/SafE family protein [Terrisporobacter hibernicus]UPA32133.1 sulfite exporter TauE/SafE family protein [Terrisporobacter glycolicus]